MRNVFVFAAASALLSGAAAAAETYPAQKLFSTSQTVVGETLVYPQSGAAKTTAIIVTLAPGGETVLHIHPTPMFAYILDGEVTVHYQGREPHTYRAGDSFMEAQTVPHKGVNTGAIPVRILAVSLGAEGMADAQAVK